MSYQRDLLDRWVNISVTRLLSLPSFSLTHIFAPKLLIAGVLFGAGVTCMMTLLHVPFWGASSDMSSVVLPGGNWTCMDTAHMYLYAYIRIYMHVCKYIEICSLGFNWLINCDCIWIGSDNDLALNMRQAINWIKDGLAYWRIYASLGLGDLSTIWNSSYLWPMSCWGRKITLIVPLFIYWYLCTHELSSHAAILVNKLHKDIHNISDGEVNRRDRSFLWIGEAAFNLGQLAQYWTPGVAISKYFI